jgi:hypothetical protein
MTHYKGRTSQKVIEREFPHVVEIAVPPLGLGAQLDAMHFFHHSRGVKACLGLGRRDEEGRDYLRWYFKGARMAVSFAVEFGGTVINPSR